MTESFLKGTSRPTTPTWGSTKGNWSVLQVRVPAETDSFKTEVGLKTDAVVKAFVYNATVTYDHHFAWIIQAHTLKYDITRSCLVSGEAGLLAGSWVGVTSPEGSVTTLSVLAEHRPLLSMKWKEKEWRGGGWGKQIVGGRKFRPLLQNQKLLKFQGPPTPLSSAGTATHTGRKGMKCGVSMGVNGGSEKHSYNRRNSSLSKQAQVSVDHCARGAAGVHRRLVSWRVVSCQTGGTKMRGEESSR